MHTILQRQLIVFDSINHYRPSRFLCHIFFLLFYHLWYFKPKIFFFSRNSFFKVSFSIRSGELSIIEKRQNSQFFYSKKKVHTRREKKTWFLLHIFAHMCLVFLLFSVLSLTHLQQHKSTTTSFWCRSLYICSQMTDRSRVNSIHHNKELFSIAIANERVRAYGCVWKYMLST